MRGIYLLLSISNVFTKSAVCKPVAANFPEGENNLPLGVQLIGDRYDDHRFLGVANWLEKECNN